MPEIPDDITFLQLATLCLEEVSNLRCASEWTVYKRLLHKHGLYNKITRLDVQSVLDTLAYVGLVKRVKILGSTYYCMPDVSKSYVPPELREILMAIRDIAMSVKSPAVGISTRSVARKVRERHGTEPSSQVIANTLKTLLKEAGLDVDPLGRATVAKKVRRRGTIYIFHRNALLETVNKYLNGHVQHEEKNVKIIKSEMKELAKELTKRLKST